MADSDVYLYTEAELGSPTSNDVILLTQAEREAGLGGSGSYANMLLLGVGSHTWVLIWLALLFAAGFDNG